MTFIRSNRAHHGFAQVMLGIVGGVTLLVTVIGTPGIALAGGYAQGQTTGVTVYGTDYLMFSYINTTTGQPATAGTTGYTKSGGNVPAGYIGIKPIMYFSNGTICREASGYAYNSGPVSSFSNAVGPGCGAGPAYYSQGYVRYYNGSGYYTYPTDASPDQNSVMTQLNRESNAFTTRSRFHTTLFRRNDRGETYGSALGVTKIKELPELIAALATDGKSGYIVRSSFLGPNLTLAQVRSLPRNGRGDFVELSRLVPVFDVNGVTKIGVFFIG
jgi:hypothetical protein